MTQRALYSHSRFLSFATLQSEVRERWKLTEEINEAEMCLQFLNNLLCHQHCGCVERVASERSTRNRPEVSPASFHFFKSL
jgi:hypothetical protein